MACEIVKRLLRSCASADRSIELTDEMISSRRLPTPRRNYQAECFPKFVADRLASAEQPRMPRYSHPWGLTAEVVTNLLSLSRRMKDSFINKEYS